MKKLLVIALMMMATTAYADETLSIQPATAPAVITPEDAVPDTPTVVEGQPTPVAQSDEIPPPVSGADFKPQRELTDAEMGLTPPDTKLLGVGIVAIILGVAGVAFFLCLIPTLIAFRRRHRDRRAILVLSILFGWLPFAWMIGLIWSLTGNVEA